MDPYDLRPYTDHGFAETLPARLSAVAWLWGIDTPALEGARVLELGCGRGGNLLPMAAGMPSARFVGVDRSPVQIELAKAEARSAGLRNVTLLAESFERLSLPPASFDYVIVHGVHSWVSPAVRLTLLEVIEGALSRGGIAYVSFNVLPGGYERLAARDYLRFASQAWGESAEDASKSVAWLAEHVSPERRTYREALSAVAERLARTEPAYAAHEYLTEEHHPLDVATFLREAAAKRLGYAGDALPSSVSIELLPPEAARKAQCLDRVQAEQLADFVLGTAFRRALLVGTGAEPATSFRAPVRLDGSRFEQLAVASRLLRSGPTPDASGASLFECRGDYVQVDGALSRALDVLSDAAPRALPFRAIAERVTGAAGAAATRALAMELFDLWLSTGALDVYREPPRFAARLGEAGERPRACALSRTRAARGGTITNRCHQEVVLAEGVLGWMLTHLDGTRTVAELTALAARAYPAAANSAEELVRASLEKLAAVCLIEAPLPPTRAATDRGA